MFRKYSELRVTVTLCQCSMSNYGKFCASASDYTNLSPVRKVHRKISSQRKFPAQMIVPRNNVGASWWRWAPHALMALMAGLKALGIM